MKDLLLFLMGAGGITILISASIILKPFREFFNRKNKVMAFFYKLLTCSMCTGFWIGLIMTVLRIYCHEVFEYLAYAGATSLFAWAAHRSVNG